MKKGIYTSCSPCGGTGTERISNMVGEEMTYEDITCRTCDGDGICSNLSLSDDLVDMLNDMNDKINDIKQKVDEM